MRIIRPSIGYPQVILNLRSGCSPAPLFFDSGGISEFKLCIGSLVSLSKCDKDRGLLLINDTSDMLNRSLTHLEMVVGESPGSKVRSRATTKPSSPTEDATPSGDGKWERREVGGKGEWKWKALQGGVTVMQGLRTGWAKASAAAMDVAHTAVDLIDPEAGMGAGVGSTGNRAGGDSRRNGQSPDGLGDGHARVVEVRAEVAVAEGPWLGDEEGVLVESSGVPFMLQMPVERKEFQVNIRCISCFFGTTGSASLACVCVCVCVEAFCSQFGG